MQRLTLRVIAQKNSCKIFISLLKQAFEQERAYLHIQRG